MAVGREALVIGGSGMLAGVSLWLQEAGYHVAVIGRDRKKLQALAERSGRPEGVLPAAGRLSPDGPVSGSGRVTGSRAGRNRSGGRLDSLDRSPRAPGGSAGTVGATQDMAAVSRLRQPRLQGTAPRRRRAQLFVPADSARVSAAGRRLPLADPRGDRRRRPCGDPGRPAVLGRRPGGAVGQAARVKRKRSRA